MLTRLIVSIMHIEQGFYEPIHATFNAAALVPDRDLELDIAKDEAMEIIQCGLIMCRRLFVLTPHPAAERVFVTELRGRLDFILDTHGFISQLRDAMTRAAPCDDSCSWMLCARGWLRTHSSSFQTEGHNR